MESSYQGSITQQAVQVAGRSIQLVRPSDPDRLLDDPEVASWNVQDNYMPYWAYLWPGALLLGQAVGERTWPIGTSALEIGCGLGLSGLVALALGLKVRFTDWDQTPLRFVEASAKANGFGPDSYSTALLDWRSPTLEPRYPLILGADVTYEAALVPLVARVIAHLLAPDGEALITDPNREAARGFGDALRAVGLATEATPAEAEFEAVGRVRGTLHRVWHPGPAQVNG